MCVGYTHCRDTCYKVKDEWTRPGTQFEAFISDSVGKCDVCFRAGYCSASHCEDQKRREEKIISQVIDHNEITHAVDTSLLKKAVHKITDGEEVEFKKLAQKVKKQTKEALKMKDFKKGNEKLSHALEEVVDFEKKH